MRAVTDKEFAEIVPGNRVLAWDSFTTEHGEWAEVHLIEPGGLLLSFDSRHPRGRDGRRGCNGVYDRHHILEVDFTTKICSHCGGTGREE
jgi:hypothetical protein